MYILHGENNLASSKRLVEISDQQRNLGNKVINLDANNLKIETLRQELEPADLFGNTNFVCLSGLLSGSKKKSQEKIIQFLKTENYQSLLLYETKAIHPSTLKQFKGAVIESFKIEVDIFRFLDKLNPNQKENLLLSFNDLLSKKIEPEFIFAMLVRQIRQLIIAKTNPSQLKAPPFAINKLRQQAGNFSLDNLLDQHASLYQIDLAIKTGRTQLDLKTLLTNFFLQL
ncbi:hypothetical protein A2572_04255 [Candidatus Collierbacteria bacterium RIFOXYD1_FULL_40_9]|uniref:DNA-directed DNA polymerase n=1 Tax=Candidatus Collierbacteria bacterium RIFOXYD1_FULL_40_9 TaxID=1817731 RepID=A0A1F5FPN5_9BACT|nr:MAG: hypothetical protein A2572_04255 [Candidatus Collierbacteria bacterium RIFOXYD1_FULL_40_9]